jgi:polyisoprenyl-teichoic acid--peptidoglycan teichoic acid transferase
VRTDIDSKNAILSLLRLVAESAGKPIQEVQFPAEDAGDGSGNVVIGDRTLRNTVDSFLAARATKGPRGVAKSTTAKRSKRKRQPTQVGGLIRNRNASEDIAAPLQVKLGRLPVYYPTLMSATGSYRVNDSRAYDIVDRAGKHHRAYRIVAYEGRIGQYYGIQGTDWRSPPILDNPSTSVTSGGRTLKLFYDGSRLKLVAWRTRRGSYWISNTLLRTLTNKQMLALARSARSLGGR